MDKSQRIQGKLNSTTSVCDGSHRHCDLILLLSQGITVASESSAVSARGYDVISLFLCC